MDSVGIAKSPPFSIMILSRKRKWFKPWKGALHQRSPRLPDILPFGDASLKALRRDEEANDDVVMPVNGDLLDHSRQNHLLRVVVGGIKLTGPVVNLLNLRGESADAGGLGILLGFQRGKTGFGVCQLRLVLGQHLLEQIGLKAAFAHQGAHDLLTEPGVLLLKTIQIGLALRLFAD